MIKNFDELQQAALSVGPASIALAAAQDKAALSALVAAQRAGLATGRLFGHREQILRLLKEVDALKEDFPEIHHSSDDAEACRAAVKSVRAGESDVLLKGKVKTGTFLRSLLDAEHGLRTGQLLSDIFMFEDSRRSGNQLVMITDGGVNPAPDLKQKIAILQNAVALAHALRNPEPKVAILSAVETVQPEMQSTVDAALIAKMSQRGQIPGCVVDGPLALDNAVSPEAAALKGIDSPVAGQADILICPDIEAANLLAKGTTYFAGFRLAHVILGASAPVLIPSRADSADAKLLSIALGLVVAESLR